MNDAARRNRLAKFNTAEWVDVHCHCLPGVDDGPASFDDSLALCRALVDDGITTVIATPHQLGRYDRRNTGELIRSGVDRLREELVKAGIPLQVECGADVRVDERVNRLLESGTVLGLGPTGRYVLLELPHDTFFDIRMLIEELQASGRTAVITHPERHPVLGRKPEIAERWIEAGAVFQVTAGSLVGSFGTSAERAAWNWMELGLFSVVATDAHDTGSRRPMMSAAADSIAARFGQQLSRTVCVENPLCILRGEDLASVHPSPLSSATTAIRS